MSMRHKPVSWRMVLVVGLECVSQCVFLVERLETFRTGARFTARREMGGAYPEDLASARPRSLGSLQFAK